MAPAVKSSAAHANGDDEKAKKATGPTVAGGRHLSLLELSLWVPFNLAFSFVPFLWTFGWIVGIQGPRSTIVPVASHIMQVVSGITSAVGAGESSNVNLAYCMTWNFVLFIIFGCYHSFWASATGKALLRSFVPTQAVPTMFAALSNVFLLCIGAAWMSCPGALWDVSSNSTLSTAILAGKTVAIVLLLIHLLHFDPFELVGTSALFRGPEGDKADHDHTLIKTGFFKPPAPAPAPAPQAPMLLEPVYTLDRLMFSVCAFSYISWGHKLEDQKLEKKFGPEYAQWRREVAAFIPFLF
eukprot:tig00000615_g2581.t1